MQMVLCPWHSSPKRNLQCETGSGKLPYALPGLLKPPVRPVRLPARTPTQAQRLAYSAHTVIYGPVQLNPWYFTIFNCLCYTNWMWRENTDAHWCKKEIGLFVKISFCTEKDIWTGLSIQMWFSMLLLYSEDLPHYSRIYSRNNVFGWQNAVQLWKYSLKQQF